jgi:hypothetical protein
VAASNIQITAGSGTRLATYSYTEGGVTVHDEKFIPGEYPYDSYTIHAEGVSGATADAHMLQIMAGASLNVRIRRIRIQQAVLAGAAASIAIDIFRLTTAGTGGTAITPAKMDTGSAAAGCTAMTLPTVKGTESTFVGPRIRLAAVAAQPTNPNGPFELIQLPNVLPLRINAGTTNGIAFKATGNLATATWDLYVEVVETSF